MSEIKELQASIVRRIRAVVEAVDAMDVGSLNRAPTVEGTNSPYVLAAHVLGNARAWAVGIAGGRAMRRDRPGEFAASGPDAASLRAALGALEREIEDVLGGLGDADLGRVVEPSKELWGASEPEPITVRRALLQVIEHASLHLGHLQLTADLLRAGD